MRVSASLLFIEHYEYFVCLLNMLTFEINIYLNFNFLQLVNLFHETHYDSTFVNKVTYVTQLQASTFVDSFTCVQVPPVIYYIVATSFT